MHIKSISEVPSISNQITLYSISPNKEVFVTCCKGYVYADFKERKERWEGYLEHARDAERVKDEKLLNGLRKDKER